MEKDQILKDVLAMIEIMKQHQLRGPYTLRITDANVRVMGGNPDDYPEISPGVRAVPVTDRSP